MTRVLGGLVLLALCCFCRGSDDMDGVSINTKPSMSWLQEFLTGEEEVHSRRKRFVGLPEGSNIEVKWSLNLPFDTYTEYKAKVQLALPIKIPFPDAIVQNRRSDDAAEIEYVGFPYEQNEMDLHRRRRREARMERQSIYEKLAATFEKLGVDGRHCILRTICDVAEAPFDQGLMGELFNTLLTASIAGRAEDDAEHYDEYIEAELHGRLNGKCEERYSKCKKSPFDLLPNAIHTVL